MCRNKHDNTVQHNTISSKVSFNGCVYDNSERRQVVKNLLLFS